MGDADGELEDDARDPVVSRAGSWALGTTLALWCVAGVLDRGSGTGSPVLRECQWLLMASLLAWIPVAWVVFFWQCFRRRPNAATWWLVTVVAAMATLVWAVFHFVRLV